ncbi:hypothetical protein N7488_010185 [Penicillium malachiteum]|nr:hypothetical protein N7488_010185 [Penicillium malachiteum]
MDSSISEPTSLLEGPAPPFDTPTDLSLMSPASNFGIPLAVYNTQDNEILHTSKRSLEEGINGQLPVNDKNCLFPIDPVLLYVATGTLTRSLQVVYH